MAVHNILTQVGEEWIVDVMTGTALGSQYIGWGNPATQPTAVKGDTTLQTEASETRVVATVTQTTADKVKYTGTITCAGAGKTIYEVGVFTLVSGGVLIIHCDFPAVTLAVGDSIAFTIEMEIS